MIQLLDSSVIFFFANTLTCELNSGVWIQLGPEVVKINSCSTQLSKNFPAHKCQNANDCWDFNIYEQEK